MKDIRVINLKTGEQQGSDFRICDDWTILSLGTYQKSIMPFDELVAEWESRGMGYEYIN